MALPAEADVRELLGRLRPGADWGWRGGAVNDPAQLRWRDSVQSEPTEAEYLAELLVLDAEKARAAATRAAQLGRLAGIIDLDPSMLTPPEVSVAVEELLFRAGALDPETGAILPIDEWPGV